jgi:hypothetical protein
MTVVRPEWISASTLGPAKTGPEIYAPLDWRRPEPAISDADPALPRRRLGDPGQANTLGAENLNSLVRRIAGASMDEIDVVIRDLEDVRAMLRNEGERVGREITGYASLSHASMTVIKVIADNIRQLKDARV